MSKIKILKETDATRCEICHQSDCYSAETDTCSRCSNIDLPANKTKSNSPQLISPQNRIVAKPALLEVVDDGLTYTLSYRWRAYTRTKNPFVFIFFWLALKGAFLASFALFLFLLIILSLFLLIIFLNKTAITITREKLIKNSGPISASAQKEILLSDIKYINYERHLHNCGRLLVRLKDGRLIELIRDLQDRDSMQFIEQELKKKIRHLNAN